MNKYFKLDVILKQVNYHFQLTEREDHTRDYWPEVVVVRTKG